ncbi:glycosyltransferase [Sphingomonas sp. NFR15]|uniref:glycosyltransferase n=1 Tax=Sphingomonas sp. NFR15 TaxID=1566282 RepID=UPI0015A23D3F|nr:glycosyltransferase [Sphingomonas sp. NFR15]
MTVSVVICTADRAVSLDRTLQSLRQLRYQWFEVVVVDGSRDGQTVQVAARHADFIRYVTCPELNLSMSRNIGIAHACGEIVAFIDDDAIPEPDWLDLLITGYEDPNVAQVGGFIRDNRGIDFQCRYLTVDRLGDGRHHEDLSGVELGDDLFLALTGTNFSARRERLLEIGGFDEEYAYFLDETDVTVRLHDRGWGSAIVPEAEIHHKYEASHMRTATRVPRTMYPQLRSKAYFCCVHGRRNQALSAISDYLADLIEKERKWKNDLFHAGLADMATVDRLIQEVEQGARDGVRDAFLYHAPRGISADLLEQAAQARFTRFPLPLPCEQRLRMCILSQDYPPVGNGGIGQWARDMAVSLAARGNEITVICRSETDYPYIDFIDGVWVHRIVPQHFARAADPQYAPAPHSLLHYSGSACEEILRIQDRRKFQVVCGPIFDLEPLVALRESGIPTIISLHTTYKLVRPHKPEWQEDKEYLRNHVEATIAKEREILATAPHIESNTRALLADLEQAYGVTLPPDRAIVIHRGLKDLSQDVQPFEYSSTHGTVRLLFVGRLELRKGADLLLDALPSLLAKHPGLVVDIVGDDDVLVGGARLRDRFAQTVARDGIDAERVTFHGSVSREELLRHYASCDIFVAPSRYESFGLIFVEAMIFSKPVVGVAVGGVVEVVTDGEDGLLIAKDDTKLLAEAISRLAGDANLRAKLGAAGRRTYETRFHIERMLDKSEAYYRKVAMVGAAGEEVHP